MKRRTLLGKLYEMNDESGKWFSRENIESGAVRMIEGKLHYAVPDILIGVPDICTGTRDTKIAKWELVGAHQIG
jgi:hypothetical protein